MNAVSAAVRYTLDAQERGHRKQETQQERGSRIDRLIDEGITHGRYGRGAHAERCYLEAFAIDALVYRSIVPGRFIAAGNYELGWGLRADARLSATTFDGPWAPPRWCGQAIEGSLMVTPEDGFGDQLLLARWLPAIKARGVRRVIVLTQQPLTRLFCRVAGVDECIQGAAAAFGSAKADNVPALSAWINICALPAIFGARYGAVPSAPYISADPEDVARWRERLPGTGLRVGLAWRAGADPNPQRGAARSVPSLSVLGSLWSVPGVEFVSLQRGDGEDEARSSALPLNIAVHDARDFADTAAIIANLDLIIGTDVGVTNLAAAMGAPTWVIGDPALSFRWQHPGWYPSGRPFKQRVAGDWSQPVADVAAALAELAGRRRQAA